MGSRINSENGAEESGNKREKEKGGREESGLESADC
jgi:hypothetical protein